jgi:hypothetical protein
MPPRAKRKRASRPASPADSPAARRTRGNENAEEAVAVLVPVKNVGSPFAAQREQGHFVDATLEVGGARITAHKTILAVHSPYLHGLFTSGLSESSAAAASSAPIVIRDVDGAAVAACVDAMYSGTIALTGATVCAVIKASNLLGVTPIEKVACQFFVERLEPSTALDALRFAESMAAGGAHGLQLHSHVLAYVHEYFADCAAASTFVDLPSSTVVALLGSDKLCVKSEEAVLSALRRWYEHDTEGRVGALEELVPLVRFPLLPAQAQLQLRAEPLLEALNKLGSSHLVMQLLLELAPAFKASAEALDCPRLKQRIHRRAFTFASVDNTNAVRGGAGGRFDEAGVLHHIATEGGTITYVNPHVAGRVVASRSSQGAGCDGGFVAQLANECFTNTLPNSWMAVDLGAGRRLTVNHYALRHGCHGKVCMVRNWTLLGSNDGTAWITLRRHDNDGTIESGFFVGHWPVEGVTIAYRHFRVHQHGKNSQNGLVQHELNCSGIELYGTLVEV